MAEITLLLHNIRSTHNVGSIFRTSEGFGVKEIILTGYTPYPTLPSDTRIPHLSEKITKQIHKTALGAENSVPFRYYDNVEDYLLSTTLPLLALEQTESSLPIRDYMPPEEYTLILGEEVHGVPPELLDRCNIALEIPMKGVKESFNVSVATGIALYALTQNH